MSSVTLPHVTTRIYLSGKQVYSISSGAKPQKISKDVEQFNILIIPATVG
jgi:hypothetical protein